MQEAFLQVQITIQQLLLNTCHRPDGDLKKTKLTCFCFLSVMSLPFIVIVIISNLGSWWNAKYVIDIILIYLICTATN